MTHQETSKSIEWRFHITIGCQMRQGKPSSYIMPAITLEYPRKVTSTAVRRTGR